jgi:tubulin-specific chaperone A
MAPPTKLAIATGVVLRLVKEEASYHKEMAQQEERIKKAETSEGDENAEYTLRQEVHIFLLCRTPRFGALLRTYG